MIDLLRTRIRARRAYYVTRGWAAKAEALRAVLDLIDELQSMPKT